jgi:hypothetical protein
MLRGLNKQDDDMSLENIFNWIWTTNILWVMGAVVLVGIGLVILFYTFDSIIDFIFSYWWILLLVPLGYWFITYGQYLL